MAPLPAVTGESVGVTETTLQPRPGWLIGRHGSVPSMRCCPSESDPALEQAAADGRERLRRASLASTDQTEPSEPPSECPRTSGRVVIELYSGSVYPDRCRATLCRFCLPLNARRRCLAITLAAPTRMVRLSWLAQESDQNPCDTALTRVGLIRRNLLRMGYEPGEWTWTIEHNPNETGYHAHMLQRGPSIPQRKLQEACKRSNAGIPWIKRIERRGIWTSRYGLKGFGADGYGLKTFRPNGEPREALRINNGRLEHHSRGFFAIEGDAIGVRGMERHAIAVMNGSTRVAFVGAASTAVDRILASDRLRYSLIRDVNVRSAAKLRALA
jgi:hypothetical protein